MNQKVSDYIEKYKSPQKEILEKIREIIFKFFPEIKEEFKLGVPYYGEGKYYLVGLKDHVNLGFKIFGLTEEQKNLLSGGGKTMKVIEVYNLEEIDEDKIKGLLEMVK